MIQSHALSTFISQERHKVLNLVWLQRRNGLSEAVFNNSFNVRHDCRHARRWIQCHVVQTQIKVLSPHDDDQNIKSTASDAPQVMHCRWCIEGEPLQVMHCRWCTAGDAPQVMHRKWCTEIQDQSDIWYDTSDLCIGSVGFGVSNCSGVLVVSASNSKPRTDYWVLFSSVFAFWSTGTTFMFQATPCWKTGATKRIGLSINLPTHPKIKVNYLLFCKLEFVLLKTNIS